MPHAATALSDLSVYVYVSRRFLVAESAVARALPMSAGAHASQSELDASRATGHKTVVRNALPQAETPTTCTPSVVFPPELSSFAR